MALLTECMISNRLHKNDPLLKVSLLVSGECLIINWFHVDHSFDLADRFYCVPKMTQKGSLVLHNKKT